VCWIIVVITALLGLYMAWNIGANDVANSMGCAVGSRSISIKKAILAAGLCEFAGAVLVGSHVTETVRKGIVNLDAITGAPGVTPTEAAALIALGMACALLAAAIWLNIATWMSMPVSTTHSIVGAVAGFGIVAAGWGAVHWGTMLQIVASWFISPVAGGLLAFILFKIISRAILHRNRPIPAARRIAPWIVFFNTAVIALAILYKGLRHIFAQTDWLNGNVALLISLGAAIIAMFVARVPIARYLRGDEELPLPQQLERVERLFVPLVIASSCCVAFSHGANDVANAVGPLAAVADIAGSGCVKLKVEVPFWILALGGGGIMLGLATFGYRVMATVGEKITQITPTRGVAANLAAMSTVLLCSKLGLPVSTTHTLVGAILGVGIARGLGAVNRQVTQSIFTSWLLTVPAAALLSVVLFVVGRLVLFDAVVNLLSAAGG